MVERIAKSKAGFRERFAMENGKKEKIIINGVLYYKYTYSEGLEFQDGNGCMFNTKSLEWVG